MPNPWLAEAQASAKDYKNGKARGEYPVKPSSGWCQKAARCLYQAVMKRPMPWARATATESMRAAERQGRAISDGGNSNPYHYAVGTGKLVPGACLYFGGNAGMGHVVVVVDIVGNPAKTLRVVKVFENTSSSRRGPGTVITTLDKVCGTRGSDSILAVVPPGED